MVIRPAAFARILLALFFVGLVLASALPRDPATPDVSRQSGWPTDTIEAWLRGMTGTKCGADNSGDRPYVSPDGLAAHLP